MVYFNLYFMTLYVQNLLTSRITEMLTSMTPSDWKAAVRSHDPLLKNKNKNKKPGYECTAAGASRNLKI